METFLIKIVSMCKSIKFFETAKRKLVKKLFKISYNPEKAEFFQEAGSGFCLPIGGYFGSGYPPLKNAAPFLEIPSRWPKQINLNSF